MVEARADVRQEVSDVLLAAQERERQAAAAEQAHRAAARRLLALREQIQQQLDNNPAPPSYDGMRREILGAQSHVFVKFLKTLQLKDGTTLMDKAEGYARKEFAAHQRRESDSFGRYSGPDYEQWRGRSLGMQRKIDAVKLSDRGADMDRQYDVPDHGR